jgi:curved DNA-binding protein CbpA
VNVSCYCCDITAIGNAFGVLSNPSKRRTYDQGDKCTNAKFTARRQQSYASENDNYDFMYGFEGTFQLWFVILSFAWAAAIYLKFIYGIRFFNVQAW